MCVVALLNLSRIGSFWFILCSYVGILLLVSGSLAELGLFAVRLRSINGVQILLFYASALLLTTCVLAIFMDVTVTYRISRIVIMGTPSNPTGSEDKGSLPDIGTYGGLTFAVSHPYAWLIAPLASVGIVLIVTAITLEYLN